MACAHCGATDTQTKTETSYVGGQGLVMNRYCVDTLSCWKRWEAKKSKRELVKV